MTIPNDWGVPDWLDASAYPQPTGRARMLVWAWEFLRRNPDYRTFWTEKAAHHLHLDASARCFVDNDAGPVVREAEDRFGIGVFPLDPTSSSSLPKFSATFIRRLWRNSDGFPIRLALKTNETGYIFDLNYPLEGQFLRALQNAKELQNHRAQQGKIDLRSNPKERYDKYTTYLRIIDAEDAGTNQSEIADILFPTFTNEHPEYQRRQTFRNHRKAALRLRDTDYRLLASMAIAPGNAK
jgi:Uncharacterized conserved protein (DUF2285)